MVSFNKMSIIILVILVSFCSHLNTGKETIVEAIDLLTHNAKNLIYAVEEVLYATERAIIKLPASEKERLNLIHQTTPDSLSTPHQGI